MANEPITTKFKVDISDLKRGISEANQNMKLANAQFKAAASGMDDWTKSSEGINAKLKQLGSVLTEQNSKLKAYQEQQSRIDGAYEKNKAKADQLKAAMEQLTSQGVSKSSAEYKKYEKALSEVEKEMASNKSASDKLKTTILNQQAAVNKTQQEQKKYEGALKDVEKAEKAAAKSGKSVEDELKRIAAESDKTETKVSKLGDGLRKGLGAAAKVGAAAMVAAGAGIVALAKQSISAYSDFEQLAGGVETLFGAGGQSVEEYAKSVGKSVSEVQGEYDKLIQGQDIVMKNAAQAYKTAGMSANQYMETVTGFSASLLQSMGGDTVAAAKAADTALTDMSDNANKMGTSMEMINNAYQGFAKQNYTMLDNLKLGYGGTKTEMERLLADAEEFSGVHYDLDNLADVYEAIHVIQGEMGITGTTAKEAASTIQGSTTMMKAAWANLLTGMADETADFDQLLTNFIDSVSSVASNLLPRIKIVIDGIIKMVAGLLPQIPPLIAELLPVLVEGITSLLTGVMTVLPQIIQSIVDILPQLTEALLGMLPQLVSMLGQIIQGVLTALGTMLPQIITQIVDIIPEIVDALVNALPLIIDGAVQMLMGIVQAIPQIVKSLVAALPKIITSIIRVLTTSIPQLLRGAIQLLNAIVQAIPQIIPPLVAALPSIITTLINGLVQALPQLLQGAIQLLMAIVQAIPIIIQQLIPQLPTIISAIVSGLLNNLPTLIAGAVQLFLGIIKAIPQVLGSIISAMPTIISSIVSGLTSGISSVTEVGKNLIQGLWNGISNMAGWIKDKISGFGQGVLNSLKSFFGIHSPSKLMEQVIGLNIAKGIGVGINKGAKNVTKSVKALAKKTISAAKSSFANSGFDTVAKNLIKSTNNTINGFVTSSTNSVKSLVNASIEQYNRQIDEQIRVADKEEQDRLKQKKKDFADAGKAAIKAYSDAVKDYATKAKETVAAALESVNDKFQEKYDQLIDKQQNLKNKMIDLGDLFTENENGTITIHNLKEQTKTITKYANDLNKLKGKVSNELFEQVANMDIDDAEKYMSKLFAMSSSELKAYNEAYTQKLSVSKKLSESIYQKDLENLNTQYNKAVDTALANVSKKLQTIGTQSMKGFINGMKSQKSNMASEVKTIADTIINQFKKTLKIKSPSRVFANKIGKFIPSGIALGIEQNAKALIKSVQNVSKQAIGLSQDMLSGMESGNIALAGVGGGNTTTSVVNNFTQTINAPKQPSRIELYRQTKNLLNLKK